MSRSSLLRQCLPLALLVAALASPHVEAQHADEACRGGAATTVATAEEGACHDQRDDLVGGDEASLLALHRRAAAAEGGAAQEHTLQTISDCSECLQWEWELYRGRGPMWVCTECCPASPVTDCREPAAITPSSSTLNYGGIAIFAETDASSDTSNCGWYGCRVGAMATRCDPYHTCGKSPCNAFEQTVCMFQHGSSCPAEQMGFFVRPPAGEQRGGCVQYGDAVVIAQTASTGDTSNCGWYGCRVASMSPGGGGFDYIMTFGHGGGAPTTFYLKPPKGQERSGCVNYGDDVIIFSGDSADDRYGRCGYMYEDDPMLAFGRLCEDVFIVRPPPYYS